jgi:predicted PurR-regulated permease PerM
MSQPWSERYRYWFLTVFLILGVALLYYLRDVTATLIVAALIAYILNPFVNFLKDRTKIPHNAAVNIVFWLTFGLILILPTILLPQFFGEIQKLYSDLEETYRVVETFLSQPFMVGTFTLDLSSLLPNLDDLPALTEITSGAFHLIETISVNFLLFLVILFEIYYLLKDWAKLREWLIALFPPDYREDVRRLHGMIKDTWSGYLRGNLVLMLIVGVVFTIIWAAIGVPAALALGVIIGLLTIIPDLGPMIGAAIAIIVALIEGSTYLNISNFWFGVLVTVIYLVVINLKNILLRPRLFGASVHMHEGVVFVVIILAVLTQGILGALIVVPVIASVGIVGRYFFNNLYGLPAFPEEEEEKSS